MKRFDTRVYSINDILQWETKGEIVLQPKFQRRRVWTKKAQSFLIDTIIRGKPVPKLYIRQIVDTKTRRTIREVVDGQQRISSILDFVNGDLRLNKAHGDEYGGMVYDEMPEEAKKEFLGYELAFDLLPNATDEEVLDIFARLNSYSVVLNRQEKLNAKFFGFFKTTAYNLAREYHTFFKDNELFSDGAMARMAEVELISDLMVALVEGIKSRKAAPSYYKKYDDEFRERGFVEKQFRQLIYTIVEIFGDGLSRTNFRRVQVFYALFCCLHHFSHGLKGFDEPRVSIVKSQYPLVVKALTDVDEIWGKQEKTRTPEERQFLEWTRRATTDAPVRERATAYLYKTITRYLAR